MPGYRILSTLDFQDPKKTRILGQVVGKAKKFQAELRGECCEFVTQV